MPTPGGFADAGKQSLASCARVSDSAIVPRPVAPTLICRPIIGCPPIVASMNRLAIVGVVDGTRRLLGLDSRVETSRRRTLARRRSVVSAPPEYGLMRTENSFEGGIGVAVAVAVGVAA